MKRKLTWNGGRWRKIYRGKLYQFDGGTGKSDNAAYQRAVSKWEAVKVSIDNEQGDTLRASYADCIGQWKAVADWSAGNGEGHWANVATIKLRELSERLGRHDPQPLAESDQFFNVLDPGASDKLRTKYGLPDREPLPADDNRVQAAVWQDRLQTKRKASSVADRVGVLAESFLASKVAEANAGAITNAQSNYLGSMLRPFVDWYGGDKSAKSMTEDKLLAYKTALQTSTDFGTSTVKGRLQVLKQWIKWLWKTRVIDSLPRVFEDLRGEETDHDIPVFTIAEVKRLLKVAAGRQKLYILLGLLGLGQMEISRLKRSEVARDSITRKRGKIRKHKAAPKVTWPLWLTTQRLMTKEMATAGELALVKPDGSALVEIRLGGKRRDHVTDEFRKARKKAKVSGGFYRLRRTSATLLEDTDWADLGDLFLGNVARGVKDKHYARPALGRLAKAVAWLGKKYGV
jgi:integrase